MRLENKVAVVTGSASGIGRAIARRPELLAEAEHLAHRLVTAWLGAAL